MYYAIHGILNGIIPCLVVEFDYQRFIRYFEKRELSATPELKMSANKKCRLETALWMWFFEIRTKMVTIWFNK